MNIFNFIEVLPFNVWDCGHGKGMQQFPFCLQESFVFIVCPSLSRTFLLSPIKGQFNSDPLLFTLLIFTLQVFMSSWN